MSRYSKKTEKAARITTVATLIFMVIWGAVSVFVQIRPFWVDEWRVIYNLKFKTATTIWGPLDFMQQFPRVYIEIIKAFSSPFDYSYFTLRLPSYLVGTASIVLAYRLMDRIYDRSKATRFLFVMILVSSYTFTEYFVQVKQYTMDILLTVFALWQLIELLSLTATAQPARSRYVMLCAGFLVVPFFSYVYPLAIAPAFAVILIQQVQMVRSGKKDIQPTFLLQWIPLLVCAVGIAVFYLVDVSQLMKDHGMHQFWGHLMMEKGFDSGYFLYSVFNLFAQIGAGMLFWYLFGIMGSLAFVLGIYRSAISFRRNEYGTTELVRLYAVLMLVMVLVLFVTGKLPVGEPRLNVFTVPSVAVLLIYFFDEIHKAGKSLKVVSVVLSSLFFVGVTGNIYTTFFAAVTGPIYEKKMQIYQTTEKAIVLAQINKMPILITPGIAFPYDTTLNLPFKGTVPGDWVLKTFPAYKVAENIPVFAINGLGDLNKSMKTLPSHITTVLAGDGSSFRIISR